MKSALVTTLLKQLYILSLFLYIYIYDILYEEKY